MNSLVFVPELRDMCLGRCSSKTLRTELLTIHVLVHIALAISPSVSYMTARTFTES